MKNSENKTAVPVLILSAHTIALGVVRSLGPAGVPVYLVSYDKKDLAHKSKYVRECFRLPHPEKNQDAFILGLLKIREKIGRAVIFAADDATLTTLAKNIAALESAFIIPSPDWSVVKKIINKNITYSIAERAGIPVPKTLLLDISAPLPSAVLNSFRFPCLIKPVQSHTYYEVFKKKMAVVNDIGELETKFNECRKQGVDVTMQEIIPGGISRGFNFNSLFYGGKIQQGFAAFKIRMTENGYGIPVVVRSRTMIQELWDYSETLLTEIGYEGYSCIEYKFDQRDGLYKLLEVNGRYNRSSMLSLKSGINFPLIQYKYITGGGDIVHKEYKPNIYYIDEFKDWQINIKSLLQGRQNVFSFLRPYFSRHVFAVFSLNDPGPFLKHAGDGLKLLTRRGDAP